MTKLNTYFVLVNGKFMVKVETTGSACHAEHLMMHQIESEIDDLEHQLQAKREQADKISALHINAQAELNAIKCNLGIKNI